MMRSIVVNSVHGGYGLSKACIDAYNAECGTHFEHEWEIRRDDPVLVSIVERMGSRANGPYADLVILRIPEDVAWEICDYDGKEWVVNCTPITRHMLA